MTASLALDARTEAIAESGWGFPIRLIQPHNPAFWLYWWFIINGAYIFVNSINDFRVDSSTVVLAVFLETLYTLPFIWFITRTDRYEREPAKLCALGFLWGGLVATWMMAAPANTPVLNIYGKLISVDFAVDWGPALTAPFTEETAKLTGVVVLVLLARQHVRSVYDGILLGMFVGLGFQVFENVQYLVDTAQANFNSAPVQDILQIFAGRGVSGVAGHWLFTGLCGGGVGYFLSATDRSFLGRLAGGAAFVLLAMFLHGLFDAVGALGFAALAISAGTLIIGTIIAWKFADRRARTWMTNLLQDEVFDGTVTREQLDVLAGPHKARGRYLKEIRRSQGKQVARKEGWILDAQTDLAAAIAATDDPSSPDALAARAEVLRLRALSAT